MHLHGIFSETTRGINNFNPPWWLDSTLIRNLEESGKYWYLEKKSTLSPLTDLPPCKNLASEGGCYSPIRASEELLPEAKRKEVEGAYDYRMRLKGCGDRAIAPIEGTYYCDSLANDAIALVKGIINALGVEEELQCFGDAWVFTLPKELSAKLDSLRGTEEWRKKITKLFNAGASIVKKLHPEGEVAMSTSLHLSGEEKPWEAHYHFNYYALPVVRREGRWEPLKRWIESKELEEARNLWKKKVQKIFNVELQEIDIKRGYLKSWSGACHLLRYLFRHPLEDLWKGGKDLRMVRLLIPTTKDLRL